MKQMLSVLAGALLLPLMAVDVYLAGDSTMADYPAERAPMTGWGQALRRYTKDGVKVHNLACPGKSTKSFRNEGRWTALLNQVSPGDYVFIQFGHNDASPKSNNRADADTEYKENMRRFIRDVKAKKANPVICTSIVWMSYRNGKISQSEYFGKYSEVARNVAAEENAALIDLNEWSKNELTKVGAEKAREYYMILEAGKYPFFPKGARDTCHLQENGAHFYAKGMISLARAQKLEVAELFNDTPAEKNSSSKDKSF
jgi:lysophospholipase L1-like esterase